ncbi:MAG: alpha-glucosidase C-terminal domain-containing protein [Chitinophagaceae bacterium]|jgi:glycosidase|nr:alpha-glucosidase C-terminal domain-containing protein [Chitinophagaceae bacterium]
MNYRKLRINLFWLIIPLMMSGCSKGSPSPTYTPPSPPPSTNTDTLPAQYGTPFANVPNTKDIIMYEVNIRAFGPSHNFQSVISRLDSIKNLGVNVLWLMPIYPVGKLNSINSPYCVQNYTAVNPDFGTLNDIKTLVSTAHSKGMSVILDWVADHTSWDNVWISNKSWYLQNASGNIISPPGQNWTDVAALNFSNSDMRKAMISAMKYWLLAANVDGFRCDYADGPPADFWAQAFDSLKIMNPAHKLILLAESSNNALCNDGFQLNYAWDFLTSLKNVFGSNQTATTLFTTNSSENSNLPTGDFKLRLTTNHDEDGTNTPITNFGGKQGSLAAFVLASYMGGVPLVYSGQEVGDPNKITIFDTSTIDWTINPDMLIAYKNLLNFRNTSDVVKQGSIVTFTNSPDVTAFERIQGTDTVLVLVNVRNNAVTYSLDASLMNTQWKDAMQNNVPVQLSNSMVLPAYGYMILH